MTTTNCAVSEGYVYQYDLNDEFLLTLDRQNLQAKPTVTVDLSGVVNSDGDDVADGTIDADMLDNAVADAILAGTATVSDEDTDVVTVTVQITDLQGNNLSGTSVVDLWLSDAAAGPITGDSFTGGGIAATTGSILDEAVTDMLIKCRTNSSGALVLTFTESGSNTLYFNLVVQSRVIAGSQSMVWVA